MTNLTETEQMGPLQVCPENPRYFCNADLGYSLHLRNLRNLRLLKN